MAVADLMPWSSTNSPRTKAFPVAAGQTILQGEPVVVDAAGALVLAGDDPPAVVGVAAERSVGAAAGTPVTVYLPLDDVLWIGRQGLARDGAGTLVTPAQTDLGDPAGLTLIGGVWRIDAGAGNTLTAIEDILDAQRRPIITVPALGLLPTEGTTILFRFINQGS